MQNSLNIHQLDLKQKKKKNSFKVSQKEKFSSMSHLFGAILAILGMSILIFKSNGNIVNIIIALIYGLSTFFLFISSAIYHAQKKEENEESFWRKMDHIAIFIMIAGTYTPICFLFLEGAWRWSILLLQWILVISGIILKLLVLNTPRWVTITIYLVQGWVAIIPIYQLTQVMPLVSIILLFTGGLSYTIGAIIYKMKKPNPIPGKFGFHEIFHIWILLGAIFHYIPLYIAFSS
ncbi:hemolysin III family protein [Promethearchaeum syntrophicum]|uniref:Hemolysin III family protein n=1 Tax=Promethearchaeum syntrophicum TaxID=2594042 RepID=A0A5B9DAK7_9ARCH|nr:hemolysin III family protein [Candidatus Prometheoarchaeum syntrophicum]QEE16259.1 hemolysin-III related [Candidatus Prometheoarchaeum syntrophicum]